MAEPGPITEERSAGPLSHLAAWSAIAIIGLFLVIGTVDDLMTKNPWFRWTVQALPVTLMLLVIVGVPAGLVLVVHHVWEQPIARGIRGAAFMLSRRHPQRHELEAELIRGELAARQLEASRDLPEGLEHLHLANRVQVSGQAQVGNATGAVVQPVMSWPQIQALMAPFRCLSADGRPVLDDGDATVVLELGGKGTGKTTLGALTAAHHERLWPGSVRVIDPYNPRSDSQSLVARMSTLVGPLPPRHVAQDVPDVMALLEELRQEIGLRRHIAERPRRLLVIDEAPTIIEQLDLAHRLKEALGILGEIGRDARHLNISLLLLSQVAGAKALGGLRPLVGQTLAFALQPAEAEKALGITPPRDIAHKPPGQGYRQQIGGAWEAFVVPELPEMRLGASAYAGPFLDPSRTLPGPLPRTLPEPPLLEGEEDALSPTQTRQIWALLESDHTFTEIISEVFGLKPGGPRYARRNDQVGRLNGAYIRHLKGSKGPNPSETLQESQEARP